MYPQLRPGAFPPSPPIPLSRQRARGGRVSIILAVTNEKNARRISLITLCYHFTLMLLPSRLKPHCHPLGPPSPPGFDAGEFAIARKRLAPLRPRALTGEKGRGG